MNNKLVMNLCIADVNDLLTKAMREHVLRNGEYDVAEVFWDERESHFRVTLEPTKVEAPQK